MTRLGARKDADEILKHPFFKDLNMEALKAKTLKAPFIPKLLDLEQLRQQSGEPVSFKDFQETIIPRQKMDLVNKQMEDFEIFGDVNQSISGGPEAASTSISGSNDKEEVKRSK